MNEQTTEERVTALEHTLATLKAELDAYKQMFEKAKNSPMARQVMAMLGVKLD